ncbi:hypothetical protein GCM10011571_04240 [Marinithermofilum abyssi]|uniref:Uncharacterized protein n=1 Tax=Marinithermofilum abyssi TaxID=1571185 RepID=A0A8J2VG01_9BACL|nr:hypothetical protein [Marinithermofilum abyssi]GGE06289.1 hypothetical protein GCM10011571_04240 [Marinithermofilum abyssi]
MQNIAMYSALISAIASLLAALVSVIRLYLDYRQQKTKQPLAQAA